MTIKTLRYLKLLHSSSRLFTEDLSQPLHSDELVAELCKKYFIPFDSEVALATRILKKNGKLGGKWAIHIHPFRTPKEYVVDEPSILIQLVDRPTAREWEDLRLRVDALFNSKDFGRSLVEILDKEEWKKPKDWPNLDLYIEMHRMKCAGKTVKQIAKEVSEIKKRIGDRNETVYGESEVRKMLKKFVAILL